MASSRRSVLCCWEKNVTAIGWVTWRELTIYKGGEGEFGVKINALIARHA